ncbi:MAG: hypothetical protein V1787_05045 [Candidatus Micrarchaeota archaeon]
MATRRNIGGSRKTAGDGSPSSSPPPIRRAVVSVVKRPAEVRRRQGRGLAPRGYDQGNMEHGILALLSFLGHSYKSGRISDDRYYEVADASLRKLEDIRHQPGYRRRSYDDEAFDDADSVSRSEKLEKNKADLEAMLTFLEDSYNEGSISAESYKELRQENFKRLSRVSRLIDGGGSAGDDAEVGGLGERLSEGRQYGEEPEAPAPPRQRRAPPQQAPRMAAEPIAPLYDDLSDSFDSNAVLRETKDIMQQLNIGDGEDSGDSAYGEGGEADEIEARPEEDSRAPGKLSGEAQVSSFINKLGGMMPKAKQAAPAAAASADSSNVPFVEGPGGTKMYGSGTEADPYRPTPEIQAPQQTAPVTEEKSPLADLGAGGDEAGMGGAAAQKVILELEKLKVKVDTVAEARNSLEERIGHIQESVGELRQMLFERDASIKEQEAKVSRFMDMVQELEPQKLMKELEKRDRAAGELSMRVEKQETMGGDLAGKVNRTIELLESIGSLKNIANVNKEIGDKLQRIEGTVNKAERLGEEIGRVYVDLNRRLEDFTVYRGKQDLMAESVKDLVQLVEGTGAKLNELVTKDDLNDLKRLVDDAKLRAQELEAKMLLMEQGRDLPHVVKELKKQKEGVELILSSNDQEFFERLISREDYERVRQANLRKLAEIDDRTRAEFVRIGEESKSAGLQEARIGRSIERAAAPVVQQTPSPAPAPRPAPVASPAPMPAEPGESEESDAPSFIKAIRKEKTAAGVPNEVKPTAPAPASKQDEAVDSELEEEEEIKEMSAEDLTALQAKLEAQAQEQIRKLDPSKRKEAGGLLKRTIGSLVSAIGKKKSDVLSSKPLRLSKDEAAPTETLAPPQPETTQAAPAVAGKQAQPEKKPFVTWRERRRQQAAQAPPLVSEQQTNAISEVKQGSGATEAVASYASEEEAPPAEAPVEDRLDERLKELKALRRQFTPSDGYDHEGAARKVLHTLKTKKRVSTRKIELPKPGQRHAKKVEKLLTKLDRRLAKQKSSKSSKRRGR